MIDWFDVPRVRTREIDYLLISVTTTKETPMKKALLATLVSLTLIAISHSPLPAQDLWLMKGHDTRRTGQSGSIGPVAVD